MKIICIARSYRLHAQEMGAAPPEKPIYFLKPSTAWAREGKVIYPPFTKRLEYETELVFRIGREGSRLTPAEAVSYVDAMTVGIDFTARDLQSFLKAQGLPWEMAKGFDTSAWWGTWLPIPEGWENVPFRLYRGQTLLQEGYGRELIFSLGEIIARASQFFRLEPGDVVFTGTPAGVGPALPNDVLEAFFGEKKVGTVIIQRSPHESFTEGTYI
ncbi:MAG: fumarylacetoacetate hydrolase family protein [Bacteroidia bacterium]|nr:fumarylacetoacetate hydrolase family protein [Bacteroidia bacterium]MCX7763431.1 fumarylacetoacetate hydrolase family protein [Bacteroidia bacterium]MDW8057596.1 fumarylacetoacetate hydrolase family protein [Bacteroidia bacterium]